MAKYRLYFAVIIFVLILPVVLAQDNVPKGTQFAMRIACQTNSMGKALDCNDTAYGTFQIGKEGKNIQIGDIIAFRSVGNYRRPGIYWTVHRVIEIGKDGKGPYWITKGDNNGKSDFESIGKVRQWMIKGIVIGVKHGA